ncbi:MAG: TraU family protein [Pseudomonadota bacterium]
MQKKIFFLIAFFALSGSWQPDAHALCAEANMPGLARIFKSINWHCMFPMTIAGVRFDQNENTEDTTQISNVIQTELDKAQTVNPQQSSSTKIFCKCDTEGMLTKTPIGIRVEFYEAARVIEVVKDAWCFPMLGKNVDPNQDKTDNNSLTQTKNGTNKQINDTALQEQVWQVHYYVFPVLALLEVLTDFICMDFSAFDLAYMTEPDPRWLDAELAVILAPETVLFANPLAQLSCVPEVITATVKTVQDPLYWCQGSWGQVFPPIGAIGHTGQPMQTVATAMGRAMFLLHRSFVLWGTSGDEALCHRVPQPIWKKSQYRWQLMTPVRDPQCRVIGEPGFKWTSMKNPPFPNVNPDNFVILLWRKRTCCAR